MSKKLLHICQDEKFIELAKFQFNSLYGNDNSYYIVVENDENNLNFVKKDKQTKVVESNNLSSVIEGLSQDSIIIFHSLVPWFYDFVLSIPKNHQLIWMFFGMEIYNDAYFYSTKKLLASKTYQLYPPKKNPIKKRIKDKLRPFYRKLDSDLPLSYIEKKIKVFNKFDFIGIFFEEDYNSIIKRCKLKSTRQLFFTYYPLEKIVDIKDSIYINKNRILIGNSGHITGNHLDVFEKLSNYNLDNHSIVLPLSYGDTKYIELVKNKALSVFNTETQFLDTFLSRSNYNQILKEVSVFILYSRRQQGVGNIIALLWFGAKVFLSNKNTIYHYLKRIGIIVFCYETELTNDSILENLDIERINYNRNILIQHLNEKKIICDLKAQIDPLMKQ